MAISKEMHEYLKSYMKWTEDGAVEGSPYFRCAGLCDNLNRFDRSKPIILSLEIEFKTLFEAEKLDLYFPFGKENYCIRSKNQAQHEDPIRFQWIKDHIEEYERVNYSSIM